MTNAPRQVMVRYVVKPERAAENEELVRAVYAELRDTGPEEISYATFVLDDGVTFVHVASVSPDTGNPLEKLAAFARFQEGLAERVVAPPEFSTLREVGSYRVFGG